MRIIRCSAVLAALLAAVPAVQGQSQARSRPPFARFVHGVDYRFQRATVTQGSITLVSYVYVPLRGGRREAVVFSHGSTGGGATAPGEPILVPRPVLEFFVSNGYTLVVPMRRGRGESGGTYGEECGVWSGACTMADEIALFGSGLAEAEADTSAVIDQVVLGRLIPKDGRVLFAGISRGGFLSLVMAARRPDLATGVINFVGGWFSVRDDDASDVNRMRLKLQTDRLASLAKDLRVPTLWIYAARDPFYSGGATRKLFDAFRTAGGKGEYVYVASHTLGSGHGVATDATLWRQQAEAFVAGLPVPAAPPR